MAQTQGEFAFAALTVKIAADISDLTSGIAKATGQLNDFAKENAQSFKAVGLAVAGIGATVLGAMTIAVKAAADLEDSIQKVAVRAGVAGTEFESLRNTLTKTAKTLAGDTVFGANEAASAMLALTERGFKPLELSAERLKPMFQLAQGASAALGSTTEMVARTIKGFGLTLDDSGRVADLFAKAMQTSGIGLDELGSSMRTISPIAKQTAVSMEETTAAFATLNKMGFTTMQSTMAIRMAMLDLLNPSKKLNDALASIGLTYDDVNIKTHSLAEVLKRLDEAGMTSAQAMEVFGGRAGPVISALLGVDESGKKAYETLTTLTGTFKNAAGAADEMAKQRLDTVAGQMNLLQESVTSLAQTMGQVFLPSIKGAVAGLTTFIDGIGKMAEASPIMTQVITGHIVLFGALATGIGAFIIVVPKLINALDTGAKSLIAINAKIAEFVAKMAAANQATLATQATTVAFGTIITGVAIVALIALISTIDNVIKAYKDYKDAVEITKKAEADGTAQTVANVNRIAGSVDFLKSKYWELSDVEQSAISDLQIMIKARQDAMAADEKAGRMTQELRDMYNQQVLSLKQKEVAIRAVIEARGAALTQDVVELQNAKNLAEVNARNLVDLQTLHTQYLQTIKDAQTGVLTPMQYADRMQGITDKLMTIYGDADKVQKKLEEFKNLDTTVSIQLAVAGEEELDRLSQKLKDLKQEQDTAVFDSNEKKLAILKDGAEKEYLITLNNWERSKFLIESENRLKVEGYTKTLDEATKAFNALEAQKAQAWLTTENNIRKGIDVQTEAGQKLADESVAAAKKEFDARWDNQVKLAQQKVDTLTMLVDAQSKATEQELQDIDSVKMASLEATRDRIKGTEDATQAEKDLLMVIEQQIAALQKAASLRGQSVVSGTTINNSPVQGTLTGAIEKAVQQQVQSQTRTTSSGSGSGTLYAGEGAYKGPSSSNSGVLVSTPTYSSSRGVLRSGQAGIPFVPRTGLYRLHKGEEVVPPERALGGGGGNPVAIINVFDEAIVPTIMAKYPNAIVNRVLASMVNSPITKKIVKQAVGG